MQKFLSNSRIHIYSSAHWVFSRIDHILGYKTSLNKFKNIKIISSFFFEHGGIKIKINGSKKIGAFTNMWKLNNTIFKRGNRKFKRYHRTNKNETIMYQNLWAAAKAVLRGKFIIFIMSNAYIKSEDQNIQHNCIPLGTRKGRTN